MLIKLPTYRQLPPLVHGEHLLFLQLLPARVHGAQLYLARAVHLTSHSKGGVIDKSANISRVAIPLHKMLLRYVSSIVFLRPRFIKLIE